MAENITKRKVDIVFCIDATGSMYPIIGQIKNNAKRLYEDVMNRMLTTGIDVEQFRVRTIAFRDYGDPGDPAQHMVESDFYELPTDNDLFQDNMDSIVASGGGDLPENGLEALYLAMKSDFVQGPKDRQVIVLFTDADALPLGERASAPDYPEGMADEAQFINAWNCAVQDPAIKLVPRAKRMIFFAPAGSQYERLSSLLPKVVFQAVADGDGLDGMDFTAIVDIICNSLG